MIKRYRLDTSYNRHKLVFYIDETRDASLIVSIDDDDGMKDAWSGDIRFAREQWNTHRRAGYEVFEYVDDTGTVKIPNLAVLVDYVQNMGISIK